MGKFVVKEELLQRSEGGLKIFQLLLSDLKKSGKSWIAKNPFRDDTKPSLKVSLWVDRGIYTFRDWAFPDDYIGNCFDFVARKFGLDCSENFVEVLQKCDEILCDAGIVGPEQSAQKQSASNAPPVKANPIRTAPVTAKVETFLKKYGLTVKRAVELNMIPADQVNIELDDGEWKSYTFKDGIYFKGKNGGKYYSFSPKEFRQISYKGGGYEFTLGDPEHSGFVVYTAGEKDAVNLYNRTGIPVLSLGGEGWSPTDKTIEYTQSEGIVNVVLYDVDDAGERNAQKLVENHGFVRADLSKIIPQKLRGKIKDVSDYIEHNLPADKLRGLIIDAVEQKSDTEASEDEDDQLPEEDEDHPEFPESPSESEENPQTARVSDPESVTGIQPEGDQLFTDEIFSDLPEIFSKLCSPFDDPRDKTIVLLASITVYSALLHKVHFNYGQHYAPTLNTLILANSGTGKGLAKWPVASLRPIQRALDEEHAQLVAKKKEEGDLLFKPPKELLVLSGDASSSGLMHQLSANGGIGLMFETEADAMRAALNNDWGDYSVILRKSAEHETISSIRRDEKGTIIIDRPKTSCLFLGTFNQSDVIASSLENGLASRFVYLCLEDEVELKDIFAMDVDLTSHFNSVSHTLYSYWQILRSSNCEVRFSARQQADFFVWLKAQKKAVVAMYGPESMSVITRMGVALLRIASVLAVYRELEGKELPKTLECEEVDFANAIRITTILLTHSMKVMDQMPEAKQRERKESTRRSLLSSLPPEFSTSKAIEIGERLKIKTSSVEKYLTGYCEGGLIERVRKGRYRKTA